MDEADAVLRRAVARGEPDGGFNLGILLEQARGDLDGAAEAWRAAHELGHGAASYNLGCFLRERGDLDGAASAWQRGAELGDGQAAANLGVLLKQRGESAKALQALRRAGELGDPVGLLDLGRLLEETGNVREAEAAYLRCIDRSGSHTLLRQRYTALARYAGLLSLRADATASEIIDAVVMLCEAEDWFTTKKDRDPAER